MLPDIAERSVGEKMSVGFDDIRIREVSHLSDEEWIPPIDAMGGPPAHVLYHDLVRFAGLRLFRDSRSRPWAVLQDGAHRRAFPVPSPELRGAIDRFRMRRNLRPVPEDDIAQFVRIVVARVFDPDVETPRLRSPLMERASSGPVAADPPLARPETTPVEIAPPLVVANDAPTARWAELGHRVEELLGGLDGSAAREVPSGPGEFAVAPAEPIATAPAREPSGAAPADGFARSGGRMEDTVNDIGAPRYVRVLTGLVRDGAWLGTTRELSDLTGDDPITVFDSLLKYRTDLASHDVIVANVRVDDGYQWLAVDRSRIHSPGLSSTGD